MAPRILHLSTMWIWIIYLTLIYLTLKMGPIGCPETSLAKYKYTLRNIAEDRKAEAWNKTEKNFTRADLRGWRIL